MSERAYKFRTTLTFYSTQSLIMMKELHNQVTIKKPISRVQQGQIKFAYQAMNGV